jgi:ferritin
MGRISEKMTEALNRQINAEMYSAYLYLAMSSAAADSEYSGAAKWFFAQAQEEMTHAMKLYDYVFSRDRKVLLEAIEKPPAEFESLKHMIEETLVHEQKVTAMINDLANLAQDERDHATYGFLQWFIDEQVEEEESVRDILAQIRIAGDQGPGLYMLDKSLGERVFSPAPESGE